jgi:pimeloyl-ACP methyl ester carboxylesterase
MAADHLPLVLLHGMASRPRAWDPLLPDLDRDRRVHALTLPGHVGGRRLSRPWDLRIEDYLDDLERQLDELGIAQADLVGNSLGGYLALRLAARGRARRVVCLAPAGGWRPGGLFDLYLTVAFAFGFAACWLFTRPLVRWALLVNPVRWLLLSGMSARPHRLSLRYGRGLIEAIAGCAALPAALFRPDARRLTAPGPVPAEVLVAWSGEDRLLRSQRSRRAFAGWLCQATVTTLPGVGHVPMGDDPKLVAETVRQFLA